MTGSGQKVNECQGKGGKTWSQPPPTMWVAVGDFKPCGVFTPTFSDERETVEGGISDSVRSPWSGLNFSDNILSLNCDVQSAL